MDHTIIPHYFALIPAAGVGARMAATCPKQYLHIAGKSILQHSVDAFLQHTQLAHVFVVVNRDDGYVAHELQADTRLTVLSCGGQTRSESVSNGLSAMQSHIRAHDWVLVHDAARPGLTQLLISRLIDAVGNDDVGGLLALPVVDTVKLQATSATETSITTLSRSGLWLAQTPQMFRSALLLKALNAAAAVTDDASAVEALGLTPKLVEGHWCNSKITRPDDLILVETYLTYLKGN